MGQDRRAKVRLCFIFYFVFVTDNSAGGHPPCSPNFRCWQEGVHLQHPISPSFQHLLDFDAQRPHSPAHFEVNLQSESDMAKRLPYELAGPEDFKRKP